MTNIPIVFSLPTSVVEKLDKEKGDVSRSRYLLRLIEKAYEIQEEVNMND